MSPEPVTVPGHPPGIYGCDYAKLMQVMAAVAAARHAALHGDLQSATVSPHEGIQKRQRNDGGAGAHVSSLLHARH